MKSSLILFRPCLVAAGLILSLPLSSLAATPSGAAGDNAPCERPGPQPFRGPPEFHPGMGPPGMGPMGPGFGPGFGAELGPPPFLAGLHLTDEQQDKVFAIVYAAAPAVREQAKALRKAHEALHELNKSDQYDESRVKTLADAAAKAESQMTVLRMRSEHEIFAVLTPEQKKQLDERHHDHDGHDRGSHPQG